MDTSGFEALEIRVSDHVAWVRIDHPPINLFDATLMREISKVGHRIEDDPEIRVAVFESANPDYFIAHADVELTLQLSTDIPEGELSGFQRMAERYRKMSTVTIGKLRSRARGGGSEFLLALDMTYGAIGRARVSQIEAGIGVLAAAVERSASCN